MAITYGALRNAYYGLAARYARGGNMRYVRFGQGGFSFPESVTNNEEARAFADQYIQEHPELSEDEIAEINQMATSFAGQGSRDTTATGTGVPPADSVATGTGVNPGETVVGTTRLPLPDSIERVDIPGINDQLPGIDQYLNNDRLPGFEEWKEEAMRRGAEENDRLNNLLTTYNTPKNILNAAEQGEISEDDVRFLRNAYFADEGGLSDVRKNREAYFKKYELPGMQRASKEIGDETKAFLNADQRAREQAERDARQAEFERQVAAGNAAYQEFLEDIPGRLDSETVEEDRLPVATYNDMYHNASRKGLRRYVRGKGWSDNNGYEAYVPGDESRYGRRQIARSIRQGRRDEIANYRNTGEYNPNEYKYAPEVAQRKSAARRGANQASRSTISGIRNGTYQSQRNGGAMMRTFIGAMRRGGRLPGKYQGGGGVGRFDPNGLSDKELMDWARAMSALAEQDAYRKGLGRTYERNLGYGYVGGKDDFMKEYEAAYQRGLNEYRNKYGEEPMFERLSVPEGTDPEYGFVAFPRTFTEIYNIDPSRIVSLGLHRMSNGME